MTIAQLKRDIANKNLKAEMTYRFGKPLNHWQELSKAEQEGRLLVLPCKVGDTVYAIKDGDVFEVCVISFRWHEWQDEFQMGLLFDHKKINGVYNYPIGNWGKTVFLTRKEAEAALKGAVE